MPAWLCNFMLFRFVFLLDLSPFRMVIIFLRRRGRERRKCLLTDDTQLICSGSCLISFSSRKEPMSDIKHAASTRTWAVWLGQAPSAEEEQWCHSYTHSPTLQRKPSGRHTCSFSGIVASFSFLVYEMPSKAFQFSFPVLEVRWKYLPQGSCYES